MAPLYTYLYLSARRHWPDPDTMKRIKYLLQRVFKMDFGRMLSTVRLSAKESGRPSTAIFFDMIWCALRYGAGYLDYRTFAFATLPARRRKTFVTRGVSSEIIRRLNDRAAFHKFEDKVLFNTIFADFLGRQWISLSDASPQEFAAFIEDKESVMVKPTGKLCGLGVEKITTSDHDPAMLYARLRESGQLLVEEYIVQHPGLSRIYPHSVNTVRIVTVATPDDVHVMFRGLRMGSGGSVVDNFHFGGMIAVLDADGMIVTDAVNEQTEIFGAHPSTGTPFKGVKIPYYGEAERMVKRAARLVPEIGYVGWGVAITENGPVFVEANHNPAYDFYQTRAWISENEQGLLPLFRRVVEGL